MKRHSHPIGNESCTLWDAICSMDNLKAAHQNAKKGKGWYQEVKMVDSDPEYYLGLLQEMLLKKTYHTSEYETFYKNDGNKNRLIYKLPYFPDRICQWAVLQVIEPILLRTLTADTYSAIPGRGIHKCLHNLQDAMRKDVKGSQYCLKLDAKKYYPSINHTILKMKYRRLFKDDDLLWLLDEIIDSVATANISDMRNIWLLDEDFDSDTGIPIGNYLSQYSGNYYLSSFDHWIKEVKGVKHYFRYMDDIVILHESKEYLHQLRKEIDDYFWTNLKLTIKENWQVFPTFKRGVDYVGYRTFLEFTLLRKSTCKSFKAKMVSINKKRLNGESLTYSEWCSINSYNGWLKHCDSYRLTEKYLTPLKQYAENYYILNIKKKG